MEVALVRINKLLEQGVTEYEEKNKNKIIMKGGGKIEVALKDDNTPQAEESIYFSGQVTWAELFQCLVDNEVLMITSFYQRQDTYACHHDTTQANCSNCGHGICQYCEEECDICHLDVLICHQCNIVCRDCGGKVCPYCINTGTQDKCIECF